MQEPYSNQNHAKCGSFRQRHLSVRQWRRQFNAALSSKLARSLPMLFRLRRFLCHCLKQSSRPSRWQDRPLSKGFNIDGARIAHSFPSKSLANTGLQRRQLLYRDAACFRRAAASVECTRLHHSDRMPKCRFTAKPSTQEEPLRASAT